MTTNVSIFLIYGWFGRISSGGFHSFGKQLEGLGYDVVFCADNTHPDLIAAQIASLQKTRKVALIGYSVGANCCAWVQRLTGDRTIDLIVGYDPTRRGPPLSNYPIGANVKRCIQYRNTGRLFTNVLFGGGTYVPAKSGPVIETRNIAQEHLLVQNNSDLHRLTIQALASIKERP